VLYIIIKLEGLHLKSLKIHSPKILRVVKITIQVVLSIPKFFEHRTFLRVRHFIYISIS